VGDDGPVSTMTSRAPGLIRAAAAVVVVIALPLLILTSCPANRDGMPGRLATAMEETVAAARSGVLALELWTQHRSTRQLVNVQLTDARDEVTKAYQGIAELRAEDPADVRRQAMLTASMTTIIGDLNAASAAVRGLPDQPDPQVLHQRLREGADTLERNYR
jgi:CheY-like chemotaxis protein